MERDFLIIFCSVSLGTLLGIALHKYVYPPKEPNVADIIKNMNDRFAAAGRASEALMKLVELLKISLETEIAKNQTVDSLQIKINDALNKQIVYILENMAHTMPNEEESNGTLQS